MSPIQSGSGHHRAHLDRPDLRAHFRYKSIPGLLLNRALVSELTHHYAYYHNAINAKSIPKHYKDAHPQFLAFEHLHKTQIYGLVNLGSDRGQCVMYE